MPGCIIGWGRSGLRTIMSDALSVRLFCHKKRTPLTLSPCFCACLSLSAYVSLCVMAYYPVVTSSLRAKVRWLRHKFREINFLFFFINDRKWSFPVCFKSFQLIHFISFFDVHVGISKDRQHISFYINIICIFLHLVIILIISIILIRSNSYWSLASQLLVVLTAWL